MWTLLLTLWQIEFSTTNKSLYFKCCQENGNMLFSQICESNEFSYYSASSTIVASQFF